MAHRSVLADSSVMIEYVRRKDKEKTTLVRLQQEGHEIAISSITAFEIYAGLNPTNEDLIKEMFGWFESLDFDARAAKIAGDIYRELKRRNQLIEFWDIFIAAVALSHRLPLATLNTEHFGRVPKLKLASLE